MHALINQYTIIYIHTYIPTYVCMYVSKCVCTHAYVYSSPTKSPAMEENLLIGLQS